VGQEKAQRADPNTPGFITPHSRNVHRTTDCVKYVHTVNIAHKPGPHRAHSRVDDDGHSAGQRQGHLLALLDGLNRRPPRRLRRSACRAGRPGAAGAGHAVPPCTRPVAAPSGAGSLSGPTSTRDPLRAGFSPFGAAGYRSPATPHPTTATGKPPARSSPPAARPSRRACPRTGTGTARSKCSARSRSVAASGPCRVILAHALRRVAGTGWSVATDHAAPSANEQLLATDRGRRITSRFGPARPIEVVGHIGTLLGWAQSVLGFRAAGAPVPRAADNGPGLDEVLQVAACRDA
jgi:hypothetical protein